MADLGDLVGSLMVGLLRARRMADEQTAALAEYYRTTPLLEGLSVPRIRIPELTIDMPVLIDNHVEGQTGQMATPAKIATAAQATVKETLAKGKVQVPAKFYRTLSTEVKANISSLKPGAAVTHEVVARSLQRALSSSLAKENITLTSIDKEAVTRELRSRVAVTSIDKDPVSSRIDANIRTADVKEQSTPSSVVRLQITIKEEGLEWTVQADETGGVVSMLTPE